MNRTDHIVYSGWMTKSPPERRLSGPWKLFRAKWKRRFFVLSKPASSLPGQYVLNYYRNEDAKKNKGYIDLEQCEQIIESLDSKDFKHLLAIKTYHKTKERTYFLATDTEEQMAKWVQNLCSVCGLKPDDNPTDLPPASGNEKSEPKSPSFSPAATVNTRPSPPVTSQPKPTVITSVPPPAKGSPYIPLNECRSGSQIRPQPVERRESVDSVPDEPAPPPPVRRERESLDDGNEVFTQSVAYDYPPPKIQEEDEDDGVYKVPPPRNYKQEPYDIPPPTTGTTLEPYDFPPTRQSPSTPRSSSSESQKVDSAYSSSTGLTYDNPPPRCDGLVEDDTYDFPSSNNPVPVPQVFDQAPARPPRPKNPQQSSEPYQNIPPNSKSFNSIGQVIPAHGRTVIGIPVADDIYDMPPAKHTKEFRGAPDLAMTVPPPRAHNMVAGTQHSYVNAATGYMDDGNDADTDEPYLSMEKAFREGAPELRPVLNSEDMDTYTDMGHTSRTTIYDHPPPSNRPVAPRRAPPRPTIHSQSNDTEETYSIFSNPRTRSFKRHGSSSSSGGSKEYANTTGHPPPRHRPDPSPRLMVQLPTNKHPDFSTSSEDEDEVLVDTRQFTGVHQPHGGWSNIPAPRMKHDGELKYLDLALEDASDKEPVRSPNNPASHSSPTEYKEIDFVKTQALSDVKKWAEHRKEDDH